MEADHPTAFPIRAVSATALQRFAEPGNAQVPKRAIVARWTVSMTGQSNVSSLQPAYERLDIQEHDKGKDAVDRSNVRYCWLKVRRRIDGWGGNV